MRTLHSFEMSRSDLWLPTAAALYTRRTESSSTPLWEPQNPQIYFIFRFHGDNQWKSAEEFRISCAETSGCPACGTTGLRLTLKIILFLGRQEVHFGHNFVLCVQLCVCSASHFWNSWPKFRKHGISIMPLDLATTRNIEFPAISDKNWTESVHSDMWRTLAPLNVDSWNHRSI